MPAPSPATDRPRDSLPVSYAGQDGTPGPFLVIISWIKVGKDWKGATEILLPVPPAPAANG
jgi:hypothetical protein